MSQLVTVESSPLTYKFDWVRGISRGPVTQVREIRRPQVDGIDWQDLGKAGEPFEWQTGRAAKDATTAEALRLAYEACRGKIVTLTTPYGSSLGDVLVLDVYARPVKALAIQGYSTISGGYTPTYLVEAWWRFQDSSAS